MNCFSCNYFFSREMVQSHGNFLCLDSCCQKFDNQNFGTHLDPVIHNLKIIPACLALKVNALDYVFVIWVKDSLTEQKENKMNHARHNLGLFCLFF